MVDVIDLVSSRLFVLVPKACPPWWVALGNASALVLTPRSHLANAGGAVSYFLATLFASPFARGEGRVRVQRRGQFEVPYGIPSPQSSPLAQGERRTARYIQEDVRRAGEVSTPRSQNLPAVVGCIWERTCLRNSVSSS